MRRREAGFTLLEVLVAFTIFAAVLVAIYGSLSTSLRGEAAARAALASTQTARSVMAQIGHSFAVITLHAPSRAADHLTKVLNRRVIQDTELSDRVDALGVHDLRGRSLGESQAAIHGSHCGVHLVFRFLRYNSRLKSKVRGTVLSESFKRQSPAKFSNLA